VQSLKRSWAEVIQPEDYEKHMANVGQAQANASLTKDLIQHARLPNGAKILFAGAGPGQMFEFVDCAYLRPFTITFTDINPKFLERLKERAVAAGLQDFSVVLDDVESSELEGPFNAVVFVLVLEHVDWRRALAAFRPSAFVLIIQRNPEGMTTAVTPGRERPSSMKRAEDDEQPELLRQDELTSFLEKLGYELKHEDYRPVADGKTMCGLVFGTRA